MKKTLLETLQERRLVCDGAMGTQLMLAGLASGDCGELWNLKHPDRVLEIHKRYAAAGADCLITNTFGANRIALARHGAVGDTVAINAAGVRIAREAFGGRAGFVLGDIGPLGAMLEPYGDLAQADAQNAFTEQANALIKAGVDAIIIETQTSLDELGLAIAAARAVGAPCIIGSLAYDLSATGSFYAGIPHPLAEFPHHAELFQPPPGIRAVVAGALMVNADRSVLGDLFGMNPQERSNTRLAAIFMRPL